MWMSLPPKRYIEIPALGPKDHQRGWKPLRTKEIGDSLYVPTAFMNVWSGKGLLSGILYFAANSQHIGVRSACLRRNTLKKR